MSFRGRRITARCLDMLVFAALDACADAIGGGVVAGVVGALSAAYLLGADALGVSAKRWLGLELVSAATGARASWFQSTVRNLPWWILPFVKNWFGTDAFVDVVARGVCALVSIAIITSLWRSLGDGHGRHWADRAAGTRVRPASERANANVASPKHEQAPATVDVDRAAPDFDDAPRA